jgi:hypothetical protein
VTLCRAWSTSRGVNEGIRVMSEKPKKKTMSIDEFMRLQSDSTNLFSSNTHKLEGFKCSPATMEQTAAPRDLEAVAASPTSPSCPIYPQSLIFAHPLNKSNQVQSSQAPKTSAKFEGSSSSDDEWMRSASTSLGTQFSMPENSAKHKAKASSISTVASGNESSSSEDLLRRSKPRPLNSKPLAQANKPRAKSDSSTGGSDTSADLHLPRARDRANKRRKTQEVGEVDYGEVSSDISDVDEDQLYPNLTVPVQVQCACMTRRVITQ